MKNMKKSILILALIVLGLSIISCTKEGSYRPGEKISQISVQRRPGTDPILFEKWSWDGKYLARIEHCDTLGKFTYSENFLYDDSHRVIRVTDPENNEEMRFSYDGKKLAKVEYYVDGLLECLGVVTHSGKNVTSVRYSYYGYYDDPVTPDNPADPNEPFTPDDTTYSKGASHMGAGRHLGFFSLLPYEVRMSLAARAVTHPKSVITDRPDSIAIEWSGSNISRISVVSTFGNSEYTFSYDDLKNPFRNCLTFDVFFPSGPTAEGLNANNIVRSSVSKAGADPIVTTYTYTYDGKFPTQCDANGLVYHYEYLQD